MHCCICSKFCNHIGGPFYCEQHKPIKEWSPDKFDLPLKEGWICPRCKQVNAPHVKKCDCKPSEISIDWTKKQGTTT
jgi:hypothetical protein